MRRSRREIFGAGAPAWYSLLALSFLFCEFNPVAALGVAAGLKNIYGGPIGWALTALSFLLALAGFVTAERTAFVDRNRRALEISGIAAIAAGLIPLLVGVEMPALIMWPISAMFLITGASGLRASRTLPHPARADDWTGRDSAAAEPPPPAEAPATGPANTRRRRRRRRRRSRNRGRPRDGLR
jgi:hypothetical protein